MSDPTWAQSDRREINKTGAFMPTSNIETHPTIIDIRKQLDIASKRFESVEQRMEKLEICLDENTRLTKDIHEWMAGFRFLGALIKWFVVVGGGLATILGINHYNGIK